MHDGDIPAEGTGFLPQPGGKIDESRPFVPLRIAVMAVSDTRDLDSDKSGSRLIKLLRRDGHILADRALVKDDQSAICAKLESWLESDDVQVVISTGGTGITGRDVTPEAFASLYDKEIPGFGELFRWLSWAKIGTSTIQSRASGGVARGKLLFCLPGSSGAVSDGWEDILKWQLDNRHRPCNFAELLSRLREV